MVNYFEEIGKLRNLLHDYEYTEEEIALTIKSIHRYFVNNNHLTKDYLVNENVFDAEIEEMGLEEFNKRLEAWHIFE